jgi:hypothetical protein
MNTPTDVPAKRRALLDAIYAIHAGDGLIRIDEKLAQRLDQAWDEYDSALTDELRAENKVLRLRGDTYLEQLQQKHAENERLREALEWVRDNTELWDAPVVLKALGT